ncbi:MAG: type II secretion system F family protein [Pirellulaceae bacterium]|jgi:general secretion pathway protein F/type IV pilus assembly protein PilC
MPDFAYVARDRAGKKVTGMLTAASEREAAAQLGTKSLFPIQLTIAKGTKARVTGRVKGSVMSTVYSQMASLLRSGVPMLRSLTVLTQQTNNPTLKTVLGEVKAKVEEGESLGDAMAKFPRVFNEMSVNMVKAGTEGGFLEDSLERVGGFIEQQEDLKGKTLGALAYPLFIMGVGAIVVTVLLVYFVPKFEPLFGRMRERGSLPAATELLLAMSRFMQSYWYIVLGLIAAAFIALRSYLASQKGKRLADWARIKTPLLGTVFLNLAVARFCRVLGTLLENGVPILRSLEISRQATGNLILSDAIAKASETITAGERLAKPLGESGHFPPSVVEMISVAEESNTLDKVLVQISEGLEKSTFRKLEIAVRLLEPLMLLLLAGVVMFVVLALMVPVLKSSSSL